MTGPARYLVRTVPLHGTYCPGCGPPATHVDVHPGRTFHVGGGHCDHVTPPPRTATP